jgi:hypothetical protein
MVFQRFISRYEAILDTLNTLYNERKGPETLGLKLIVSRKDIVALFSLYFCINSESSSMVCVTLVANMVKLICSSCRYNVQAQHIYRF